MTEQPAPRSGLLRLGMLRETYDLAVAVAGSVWPTPEMALGRLFERGVAFIDVGSVLPPIEGRAPSELLEALNRVRDDLVMMEAQFAFTKYITFVLTREGEALEATWLQLADQHLDIRAEIVRCRREEERLKRDLAALGAPVLALPEHDDVPETPRERARKSRGMYAHLFDGASVVEAVLDVAPATLARAERLAAEQEWDSEWGADAPLVIFAHGLSAALREREADEIDPHSAASVEAGRLAARQQLMGQEGRYATLRYRLFELRRNNHIVGWRITALRVEAGAMRRRLDQFLEDRDRLEAELARLRAEAPPRQPAPPQSPGWRARLARLFTPPDRDED